MGLRAIFSVQQRRRKPHWLPSPLLPLTPALFPRTAKQSWRPSHGRPRVVPPTSPAPLEAPHGPWAPPACPSRAPPLCDMPRAARFVLTAVASFALSYRKVAVVGHDPFGSSLGSPPGLAPCSIGPRRSPPLLSPSVWTTRPQWIWAWVWRLLPPPGPLGWRASPLRSHRPLFQSSLHWPARCYRCPLPMLAPWTHPRRQRARPSAPATRRNVTHRHQAQEPLRQRLVPRQPPPRRQPRRRPLGHPWHPLPRRSTPRACRPGPAPLYTATPAKPCPCQGPSPSVAPNPCPTVAAVDGPVSSRWGLRVEQVRARVRAQVRARASPVTTMPC